MADYQTAIKMNDPYYAGWTMTSMGHAGRLNNMGECSKQNVSHVKPSQECTSMIPQ